LEPDQIAAVIMGHIPEMIVALVGILKSGAAYLPIDPEYPQERIDYILEDSGAKIKIIGHLPPAARNLFEKRFLDFPKLLTKQKFFGGPGGDFTKKPPG
jgi:non-ribosomal peptide synthetase component F